MLKNKMKPLGLLFGLSLLFLGSFSAQAQQAPNQPAAKDDSTAIDSATLVKIANDAATAAATAVQSQQSGATVIFAPDSINYLWNKVRATTYIKKIELEGGEPTDKIPEAGLGNIIRVTLNHEPKEFENDSLRANLRLCINGLVLKDIQPMFNNNDSLLIFKLERGTKVTADVWDILLQIRNSQWTRPVTVSICTPTQLPLRQAPKAPAQNMDLIIMRTFAFWGMIVFLGFVLFLIFWAGKNRDIFRDDTGDPVKDLTATFSLARTQLAFWTFVIVLSFLFIWAITGVLPTITTDTLYLLGISVSTTGAALVVETFDPNKIKGLAKPSSGSFWRDILSDSNGMSIHRAQMVIWTLIIGFFYVREAFINFSMPDLDNNLLILMGLSAGTYVGLKTQEKSGAKTVAVAGDTNPPTPPNTPVTPVDPNAPVNPAAPVAPVAPADPAAPVEPVTPTDPPAPDPNNPPLAPVDVPHDQNDDSAVG